MRRSWRWMFNVAAAVSLVLALAVVRTNHRITTRPNTIIQPLMRLEITAHGQIPPPTLIKTVDLSGRTNIPAIGKTKASRLTCAQLAANIDNAYMNPGETAHASFSVRIVGFQPPAEFLASLLILLPAQRALWYLWLFWKNRRRLAPGLCPHCGYNLTANTSGICPECGTAIRPARI